MIRMFKVIDFFCGAGGMGLGFKNAGFEIVAAYDFDKYAVQTYKHNVGDHVFQQDISKLAGTDLPKSDVWTFGFPCQDISICGKMAGMIKSETRSGMFYEIMRLLGEASEKPQVILAENVKQVKKYLPTIEEEYNKQGYRMFSILYNSKYWGVPQNRERYFIIGVREDVTREFNFPIQPTEIKHKLADVLENEVDEKFFMKYPLVISNSDSIVGMLNMKATEIVRRVYDPEEHMSPTLTTCEGGHRQPKIIVKGCAIRGRYNEDGSTSQNLEIRKDDVSNTVTTVQKDSLVLEDLKVRKLTPREFARLQGFPDTFEQIVSDSQFYKQMGNAVTVNVSEIIALSITDFLEREC